MPRLTSLRLDNFRNISGAALNPHPNVNLILGPNGAGKSSLLEAMSILAHGRSFRTNKYRSLIQGEHDAFTVFARLFSDDGMENPIGVRRLRSGDLTIKISERKVSSASELAACFPLLVIDTNSFRLVEGSPKERRKFFDWIVFHVKHEFGALWKNYSRCLKQRNALLRDKIAYPLVEPWDNELARLATLIDQSRRECWAEFLKVFAEICTRNEIDLGEGPLGDITISYVNGWRDIEEGSFVDQLRSSYPRDLKLGFTSIGAHKADFVIKAAKRPAMEVLSRGQTKLLISVMYVTEAQMYAAHLGAQPVVAIDDMPSELDLDNQRLLATLLLSIGCQCFVTAIDEQVAEQVWPGAASRGELKMFHVKHGAISEHIDPDKYS